MMKIFVLAFGSKIISFGVKVLLLMIEKVKVENMCYPYIKLSLPKGDLYYSENMGLQMLKL
jgi:hypothetical protein